VSDQWQVPRGYEHGYQWGVYPPPGYEPVYLVPRPPRPTSVRLAITLTYVGVGVATLEFLLNAALTWHDASVPTTTIGNTSLNQVGWVVGLVVAGVISWLLPGAGSVICAVLAWRGANPARIVLASLMGLFAVVNLCQGVASTVNGFAPLARTATSSSWIAAALSLIDFGLSVTIGVLLLVPSAQRFFSPGPGRRFAPAGAAVPSIHDRP